MILPAKHIPQKPPQRNVQIPFFGRHKLSAIQTLVREPEYTLSQNHADIAWARKKGGPWGEGVIGGRKALLIGKYGESALGGLLQSCIDYSFVERGDHFGDTFRVVWIDAKTSVEFPHEFLVRYEMNGSPIPLNSKIYVCGWVKEDKEEQMTACVEFLGWAWIEELRQCKKDYRKKNDTLGQKSVWWNYEMPLLELHPMEELFSVCK